MLTDHRFTLSLSWSLLERRSFGLLLNTFFKSSYKDLKSDIKTSLTGGWLFEKKDPLESTRGPQEFAKAKKTALPLQERPSSSFSLANPRTSVGKMDTICFYFVTGYVMVSF